jgi:Fe-Mn family superoxide dismutase
MRYELKPLPYSYDALSPVISVDIMKLHHDIHHLAYVNGANLALDMLDKGRAGETINMKAVMRDLSFNLNGHLMHELFWDIMRAPVVDNKPSDKFIKLIVDSFGSFENFKKEFGNAAKTVEGSGWAVLYTDLRGDLFVGQLEKHNLLGINGMKVILALDVWEHAYYLDYKNDRATYVDKWWDIVNWDKVEELSLNQ